MKLTLDLPKEQWEAVAAGLVVAGVAVSNYETTSTKTAAKYYDQEQEYYRLSSLIDSNVAARHD